MHVLQHRRVPKLKLCLLKSCPCQASMAAADHVTGHPRVALTSRTGWMVALIRDLQNASPVGSYPVLT